MSAPAAGSAWRHQGDDEGGLSVDNAGAMFRAGTASEAARQKEELAGDCR